MSDYKNLSQHSIEALLEKWLDAPWCCEKSPIHLALVLVRHCMANVDSPNEVIELCNVLENYLNGVVHTPQDSNLSPDAVMYEEIDSLSEKARWACWEKARRAERPVVANCFYGLSFGCVWLTRIAQKVLARSTASGYACNAFLDPLITTAAEQLSIYTISDAVVRERWQDFVGSCRELSSEEKEAVRIVFTTTMNSFGAERAQHTCQRMLNP